MFELLLRLVFAHLIGDFVLQTNRMINDIAEKGLKSFYFYLHALIHFLLIVALTQDETSFLPFAVVIAILHLLIDILTKIVLKDKISPLFSFIFDQFLHLIILFLTVSLFLKTSIAWNSLISVKILLLYSTLIGLTSVTSILIKKAMTLFNYEGPNNGLKNAGKYIGHMERLIIFGLVVLNYWQGIGFLLAAKSIFRYGDLTKEKDIKMTEYVLLGTLISFGLAIVWSVLFVRTYPLLS